MSIGNLHLVLGNRGKGTLAARKKAELASAISKDLMQALRISDKTQRLYKTRIVDTTLF